MKIKKSTLYDVMNLIGVLEKIRIKEVLTNKKQFSKLLWRHFGADLFDGDSSNKPILIIEFAISNTHYISVELDVIENKDETFYIKGITVEIIKY